MGKVSKSKIQSTNGQHYYRFNIYYGQDIKMEYVNCSDYRFYNRPETTQQKNHNKENKRLLQIRQDALQKSVNDGTYNDGALGGDTPLFHHWDWVRDTRGANNDFTYSSYNSTKKHFIAFMNSKGYNPDIKLSQVNKKLVLEFKAYIMNDATIRGAGFTKIKANSQNNYFIRFCVILNDAVDQKLIIESPARGVSAPPQEDTHKTHLTIEELEHLKTVDCEYPMVKNAFLFACFTGLRGGDIATLKWSNLPIIKGKVTLDIVTGKKKVPLSFSLTDQASEWLPERRGAEDKVFEGFKWGGYYNDQLKYWILQAGFLKRGITSHSARHTFAIHNLQAGVSLYHVSKLLAHDSIRTTEDHYAQYAKEDLDKALAMTYGT